jgi:hypothetical protein
MTSITLTHDLFLTLSSDARAEIVAALIKSGNNPAAAALGKKAKKVKKEKDPDAPKRPANDWIKFSTRVEKLIRESEVANGVGKDAKMKTTAVKKFASDLKKVKAYSEWADADILDHLTGWTPSSAPSSESEGESAPATPAKAAAAAAEAPGAPAKRRGPKKLEEMTEEERTEHKKRIEARAALKKSGGSAAAAIESS